jgi:SAM-dependent methyltransferase
MTRRLDAGATSAPLPIPDLVPRICPACGADGAVVGTFVDKDGHLYGLPSVPVPLRRCTVCKLRFFDLIRGVNTAGEIYARMTLSTSAPKARHYTFARLIERSWSSSMGLEVGAGRCHVGRLLRGGQHSVVALDRYGPTPPEAPGIQFIDCDLASVTPDRFAAEQFDWILADNVLEHLPQFRAILDCSYAWLKRDGYLIVSVPNGNTLKRFAGARHRAEVHRPVEHVNIFDGNTLDAALARSGFKRRSVAFLPAGAFEVSVLLSLLGMAPFGLYRVYSAARK